jgi:hypothetical protein
LTSATCPPTLALSFTCASNAGGSAQSGTPPNRRPAGGRGRSVRRR